MVVGTMTVEEKKGDELSVIYHYKLLQALQVHNRRKNKYIVFVSVYLLQNEFISQQLGLCQCNWLFIHTMEFARRVRKGAKSDY